jgi:hypothetical protein
MATWEMGRAVNSQVVDTVKQMSPLSSRHRGQTLPHRGKYILVNLDAVITLFTITATWHKVL